MKRLLSRVVAACLGVAAVSTTAAVHAAEDTTAEAPRSTLPGAEVVVVGEFRNADAVGARVTSWFEGQAIPASASRTSALGASEVFAPGKTPGVRVWVIVPTPAQARLFFAVLERAGGEPRFLVQDVELSGGFDELGLERLAQVAYLSAIALWEGNAESSRREVEQGFETPAVASRETVERTVLPQPAEAKKPAPRWVAHGVLTFDARFHGPEGAFLGPLMGLLIGHFNGTNAEWTVGAGVRWFLDPHEVRAPGMKMDFLALGYGLTLGHTRQISGPFWLGGELGPELQQVYYRVLEVDDPSLDRSAGGYTLRPGIFSSVTLGLKVHPLVMITVSGMLGVPLVRTHYDIRDTQVSGGSQELLAPWAVQPGFSIGMRYL